MRRARPTAIATALLLAACGGGAPPPEPRSGPPVGMSGGELPGDGRPAGAEGSVELTLRRADGTFVEVSEQRGHVVLLFVLATFDGASQMLLNPLRNVIERHPDLVVLGIAAEPSARLLVDAYEHALNPPFPITYDPNETVRGGGTALGAIESIPTLIVLNRRGVEVARHTGVANDRQIEELLSAAN